MAAGCRRRLFRAGCYFPGHFPAQTRHDCACQSLWGEAVRAQANQQVQGKEAQAAEWARTRGPSTGWFRIACSQKPRMPAGRTDCRRLSAAGRGHGRHLVMLMLPFHALVACACALCLSVGMGHARQHWPSKRPGHLCSKKVSSASL